jgi:putative ABC transport system permease protein
MSGYFELSWTDVVASLSLVGVLLVVTAVQRLGIGRSVIVGTLRTFVQLLVIGYVLKFIFDLSKWYWVLLMLAVMVAIAARTAASREESRRPGRMTAAGAAIGLGVLVTMATVVGLVIRIRPWFLPQVLIPISGMVIGNTMNAVALTTTRFTSELGLRRAEVEAALALGATSAQASMRPFRSAIKSALIPTLNALMVVGLVQLPGMMSGQIIAGVLSVQAVRYQIVVMYMIACGAAVGSLVAAVLVRRQLFTPRHQLRSEYL